ncbi:MAG: hypothetical protein ABI863_17735 [Ginsengibacter sp.]
MRESIYNFNGTKKLIIGTGTLRRPELTKDLYMQRCHATQSIQYSLAVGQKLLISNCNASPYKTFVKRILPVLLCSCMCTFAFTQASVSTVNSVTNAASPVTPFISTYVSSTAVTSMFTPNSQQPPAWIYGQINCISPTPFSIALDTGYRGKNQISLANSNVPVILRPDQRLAAFGDFNPATLVPSGINLASITDAGGNIKLPNGNYTICFTARNSDYQIIPSPIFVCGNFTIACGVLINTMVRPPVGPLIARSLANENVGASVQIRNSSQCNTQMQVKLFGKIECLSPAPFTIQLNPQYNLQPPITVNPGVPLQLTSKDLLPAFGNFLENNLVTTGVDLASVKDVNNNIKLPDGNYRICFYARYLTSAGELGDNASDPNLGCGTFNICNRAGGAPQFTQPVSNLNINAGISVVQPASPLIFTWTPPQSACGLPAGGYTYDFEIRELFANQNVNDAINNPFVFRKTSLPSPTFLLDTNLNKNVLHEGRKYAVRVRAVSANLNSPVEIDNSGYSRIEAFQYGANLITYNGVPHEPEDYYIPFMERKSDFWDGVYSSYRKRTRGDTLVPVKEYIAFALTQNSTAYNLDAIELFLSLNPELAELKKVKISYTPKLPEFPSLPVNDQNDFDKEHGINLEPDKFEENKFLKYLDTLNNYKQKIPANAARMISDLTSHLNSIKTQVDSVDRVSVNLINTVLSELLYELRRSSQTLDRNQLNQLQGLVSTLQELTALSPNSTSFFYEFPGHKTSSLSSYRSHPSGHSQKISLVNNAIQINDDGPNHILAAIIKQLLPFDVIVYRYSKETPAQPFLDAPDLSKTYRIFYTLPNLYNHKNPEVNARSATRLASTVQVSLPSNITFTFWTLNMLNHKNTKPEDVDLKDVLSHTNKILPGLKKPSIVLKVD